MVCEHFLYCFHNFSVNLKLLNVNVYFKKCPFLPESHSCENYLNFPGPQNGRTPKQIITFCSRTFLMEQNNPNKNHGH